MSFGGSLDPCASLRLVSIGGLDAKKNSASAAKFTEIVCGALGVNPGRVFIEYVDAPPHMFAWNGSTFA